MSKEDNKELKSNGEKVKEIDNKLNFQHSKREFHFNLETLDEENQFLAENYEKYIKTPALIRFKAYKRIVGYATRYASNDIPEKEWREVYGILIGSIENQENIIIKDAIPMVVGDRAGVKYENKQYVDMAQIDNIIYERAIQDKKNDFIIGWWHTHPGFPFKLSEVDIQTQLGYQLPNPYAIALIFNHCELKSRDFFLGLAGLRLSNPKKGIWSPQHQVELLSELNEEEMVKKVENISAEIRTKMKRVLKEIEFIDKILLKKGIRQLQKYYGLIPSYQVQKLESEQLEDTFLDENILYVWNPEFEEKDLILPKFRIKIERDIDNFINQLKMVKKNESTEIFFEKRKKFKKKITRILSKVSQWSNRLMESYSKRVKVIYPYYDYLDTNERKVLETFEGFCFEYNKILEDLFQKADFVLENERD